MSAAISTRHLTRRFADHVAVDQLNLEIGTGEIYGFLGPNGAGKSTTVRMLCTLLGPSEGTASIVGHDLVREPDRVRLNIGAALQEAALDPRQTGIELMRLQGRLYGLSTRDIGRRVAELTELIDLGDALARPIDTYSGGMRRRLDLAVALVHNPQVLFLDEPTTGLDPVSRSRVWDEVARLNRELGMTILLTTQYLEEADMLAGRVGIIDRGTLVAEGTPDELKRTIADDVIVARVDGDVAAARASVGDVRGVRHVEVADTELTIAVEHGPATIGPVAIALDRAGVPLVDLTLRTPTLDDVFLELTGARIRRADAPSGDGDRPEHEPLPITEPAEARS